MDAKSRRSSATVPPAGDAHAPEPDGVAPAVRAVARPAAPPVLPFVAVPATEAQNGFGRLVDQAAAGQDIAITRHNVPRAVLVSAARYHELVAQGRAAIADAQKAAALDALAAQVDGLYAEMQTPAVRAANRQAFRMSPATMGAAAVGAAREARHDEGRPAAEVARSAPAVGAP